MKKIFRYLFLLFLILLIFGGFYFLFKSIKIQNIFCKSQYGSCDSNLQSKITNLKKQNIFQTKSDLTFLLKNTPSVLDYSIEFKFPLNFEVNVIERHAIVAFGENNGKFLLVDTDGIILDKVSSTNLPKINSTIAFSHDEVVYISNLVYKLYTLYKPGGNVNVSADGIAVSINNKNVIFPLDGDIDVLIGSLKLILSRLPSVSEASTIDLRYKNPVLR